MVERALEANRNGQGRLAARNLSKKGILFLFDAVGGYL